jgi:pyridinium-3,5-biscarboxylic acid mononucleotide synthase
MHHNLLKILLDEVAAGHTTADAALVRLRDLPFEQLDFARIDHHRALRQGQAEVIFGQGKTPAQIADIATALLAAGSNVLCTRTTSEAFAAVRTRASDAVYDELAHTVAVVRQEPPRAGRVGVVCAGTSDLPVAREAMVTASFFGAEAALYADVGVAGLHRLLTCIGELRTCDVLIVVAGMEGALPSVVGGLVAVPVIAVPTSVGYGANFGGLATLLAMLNSCASGITVVNIDNGFGAAAAAQRILHRRAMPTG